MRKLKELGTDVLLSVMEEQEYRDFKIPDLYEADEIEGIGILRFAKIYEHPRRGRSGGLQGQDTGNRRPASRG